MSVAARDAVWYALDDVPPSVGLVALALADVANDLHQHLLFASVDSIAEKTGRDRRVVQRALRWLEDAGWIIPTGRRPRGVIEYRWHGPGGGTLPPPGGGTLPQGGGTLPPHGGGTLPPEPKKPKGEPRAHAREAVAVAPSARFPTNRTQDRAGCAVCADTGWVDVPMPDGRSVAARCTHPRDAQPSEAVDVDEARRRMRRALAGPGATVIDQEGPACPNPITSSCTEPRSTSEDLSAPGDA